MQRLRQQSKWHARQIEIEELRRENRSVRRIETLRRRARTLENQLVSSVRAMSATDQQFAALQGASAATVEEIREVVAPGTVLLEYYEARGQIYACVLDRDRLDVVPIASGLAVHPVREPPPPPGCLPATGSKTATTPQP